MSFPALPASLRDLAAQLPFGLDNAERVGAAFVRWCEGEDTPEKHVVELWTYCFVRRYFLIKFAVRPARPVADLEELVERAYRKVEAKRGGVREPRRYAHWVSVVCRNTFLNYVDRERPPDVSLDGDHAPPLPSGERVRGELGLAREVVTEAVERLPDYLQPVAQMRFLEGCSYQKISEETGTAVPTARTYAGRAREHLREDPAVRTLLDESRW